MRKSVNWLGLGLTVLFLGACARALPPYEKRLPHTGVMTIRTTAYTHTEADHLRYGPRNALGTPLKYGAINSAAADWSRYPVGTIFRVVPTNEIYQVDDYGWMISGTNTIDLYKPTRSGMNEWGVRRVTIEILQWGSVSESYHILKPRSKYRHIKRMVHDLEKYDL